MLANHDGLNARHWMSLNAGEICTYLYTEKNQTFNPPRAAVNQQRKCSRLGWKQGNCTPSSPVGFIYLYQSQYIEISMLSKIRVDVGKWEDALLMLSAHYTVFRWWIRLDTRFRFLKQAFTSINYQDVGNLWGQSLCNVYLTGSSGISSNFCGWNPSCLTEGGNGWNIMKIFRTPL